MFTLAILRPVTALRFDGCPFLNVRKLPSVKYVGPNTER
jgi:hypothetical protein